jgi:hypothetical protein
VIVMANKGLVTFGILLAIIGGTVLLRKSKKVQAASSTGLNQIQVNPNPGSTGQVTGTIAAAAATLAGAGVTDDQIAAVASGAVPQSQDVIEAAAVISGVVSSLPDGANNTDLNALQAQGLSLPQAVSQLAESGVATLPDISIVPTPGASTASVAIAAPNISGQTKTDTMVVNGVTVTVVIPPTSYNTNGQNPWSMGIPGDATLNEVIGILSAYPRGPSFFLTEPVVVPDGCTPVEDADGNIRAYIIPASLSPTREPIQLAAADFVAPYDPNQDYDTGGD